MAAGKPETIKMNKYYKISSRTTYLGETANFYLCKNILKSLFRNAKQE